MFPALWAIYFLGCGPTIYGLSVVITRLVVNNGWNENLIGYTSSINTIGIAATSVLISSIVGKLGYRGTMILGGVIGTLGFLGLAFLELNPALYLVLISTTGICDALTCLTPGPGLVNRWFDRNKALPMSLLLCAGAAAGFALPMAGELLSGISVPLCYGVYGIMTAAIAVLAVCFIKERPEDVGEVPDGRAWLAAHPVAASAAMDRTEPPCSLGQCYRSGSFYMLTWILAAFRAMYSIFSAYVVIYALSRNVHSFQAAFLLTIAGVLGLLGRLSAGASGKVRLPVHWQGILGMSLMAGGGMLLAAGTAYPVLLTGAVLLGLGFGFMQSLFPLLLPLYFGPEHFTALYGTYNMIGSLVSAAAVPLAIGILSWFGGYGPVFGFFSLCCGAGAVLWLLFPAKRIGTAKQ